MAEKRLLRSHRHGHVGDNPTGAMAKCLGPMGCAGCRAEMDEEIGPTRAGWHHEACDMNAVDTPDAVMLWACRYREAARELGTTASALRDLVEDLRHMMPALIHGTALYDSFTRALKVLLMEEEAKGG